MTNEERDLISKFVARVGGAPQSGGFLGGSVPSSTPALPPIDRDADGFLAQQFQQYPEARYRITQTAIVTEAALAEAQNRIKRLEWELEQTKQAAEQALQQAQSRTAQPSAQPPGQPRSGGFFGSLFGSGQQAPAQPQQSPWGQQAAPAYQQGYQPAFQPTSPPPQPQYAPGYQPGMFQRGGSGFLGSALTTAAGVAGGMVVGNALMNAFEGHHNGGDGFASNSSWGGNSGGGGGGGGATDTSGSVFDNAGVIPTDPTAGYVDNSSYADPFAAGGAPKDSGFDTQSSWDQSAGLDNGGGFDAGGGFDSGSGGGGFDDNA